MNLKKICMHTALDVLEFQLEFTHRFLCRTDALEVPIRALSRLANVKVPKGVLQGMAEASTGRFEALSDSLILSLRELAEFEHPLQGLAVRVLIRHQEGLEKGYYTGEHNTAN